jgi:O-antigen/teichoic acid export membrane protein
VCAAKLYAKTKGIEMQLRSNLYSRIVFLLLFFLTHVLLSRRLGAETSGQVFFLTNMFQLIMLFVSLNTEAGIGYMCAGGRTDKKKALSFLLIILTAVTLFLFVFSFFFGSFLKTENSQLNDHFTLFLLCNVGGILLINFIIRLFNAVNVFSLPNLILAGTSCIFLVYIIATKESSHNILTAYFLLAPIQGIVLLTMYMLHSRPMQLIFPGKDDWIELLRYSLKSLAANAVFFLVLRFDYWIVQAYCTPMETGNYLQASKIGQMLLLIPQILASVIVTASAMNTNDTREAIARLIRILLHSFALVYIVLFLYGDILFMRLFGESFSQMNTVFILLLPGLFFLSALALYSAWFAGQNKIAVNFKGAVYALVFVSLADILFIPLYGIKAAAVISSIGYGINLAYAVIKYKSNFFKMPCLFKTDDYKWLLNLLSFK